MSEANVQGINPDEVIDVWREVLAVEAVRMDDNFFKLGGDSLMAATLMAYLEERFGVQMDPVEVFMWPVFSSFFQRFEQVVAGLP